MKIVIKNSISSKLIKRSKNRESWTLIIFFFMKTISEVNSFIFKKNLELQWIGLNYIIYLLISVTFRLKWD